MCIRDRTLTFRFCQPWNALQFLSPKRVLRFADPTKTAFSKSVGWVPKHCLEKPQIFISHRSQKSLINPLNRFTFSAGVEYYAIAYFEDLIRESGTVNILGES